MQNATSQRNVTVVLEPGKLFSAKPYSIEQFDGLEVALCPSMRVTRGDGCYEDHTTIDAFEVSTGLPLLGFYCRHGRENEPTRDEAYTDVMLRVSRAAPRIKELLARITPDQRVAARYIDVRPRPDNTFFSLLR
jgi:hypothetical protein